MINIIYIVLGITGILLIVWGFIWLLGKSRRRKDMISFIQQLSYLDACIKYGLVNDHSVGFIKEKFNEIGQLPDADPQKIRQLKEKFKERYAEFLQEASDY
jgi:hypothetical protein